MVARFIELKALAEAHGSRVVIWIPPTPNHDSTENLVEKAGEQTGIPVIKMGSSARWSREAFSDGYHMTPEAAKKFSGMLLQALLPLFAEKPAPHPNES